MLLTQKLFRFLYRRLSSNPQSFLALRLNYAGGMTWTVADNVLTTAVTGGIGASLSIDLTQYTLGSLVSYLAAQPGYSIAYADNSALASLSAAVLLDGSGDISASNGNAIYAYTSVLYAYLNAMSVELNAAAAQIPNAIAQMSIPTASDEWLDYIGGFYGVPRMAGELDAQYGPRIIAEVLRPRANNVAIEMAISAYTGASTAVTDVVEYGAALQTWDGAFNFDGSKFYNATQSPQYGLFDVAYGYDLINGSDQTSFAATIAGIVDGLRDAGTHLRALSLGASSALADSASPAPTDAASLTVINASYFDGTNLFDGVMDYNGTYEITAPL